MTDFINHNSAVLALVLIVGLFAYLAWRNRSSLKLVTALTMIAVLLGFGYMGSGYGPSDLDTLDELDAIRRSGTPVVLEVFSDHCTMCLVSKREVDQLQKRLAGDAKVVRLNLSEEVGQAASRVFGVSATPTFIVFGPEGRELFRQSGYPDIERLAAAALNSMRG